MKKVILIATVLIISLASCKKEVPTKKGGINSSATPFNETKVRQMPEKAPKY